MNFFRKTALFLLVLSVLAACGSFVSQYVLGMNPCVLCIVQRLCVLAVGGGFAGGIFPSVFQSGADVFRFAYQRACCVRDRDGGLSVVVAKSAAGYGTFLRRSVDVPLEGLAVV